MGSNMSQTKTGICSGEGKVAMGHGYRNLGIFLRG